MPGPLKTPASCVSEQPHKNFGQSCFGLSPHRVRHWEQRKPAVPGNDFLRFGKILTPCVANTRNHANEHVE
jgi:hypothetical protein